MNTQKFLEEKKKVKALAIALRQGDAYGGLSCGTLREHLHCCFPLYETRLRERLIGGSVKFLTAIFSAGDE